MDHLFQQSQQDFFRQFTGSAAKPSQGRLKQETQPSQAVDIMDERDEQLHDYIRQQVGKEPRLITGLSRSMDFPVPDVRAIIENFRCTICMEPVSEPTVIKHCLHFFCKSCVETSIRQYKKECPLCKETMKTHRELRQYTKMQRILKLLAPLIQARLANENVDIQQITHKMQQEQADMLKVHEERQPALFASSKYSSKGKGRKPKFTEEMEDALDVQAVERDTLETAELDRIKRKVQKIRQIQDKRLQKHKKLEEQTFKQVGKTESGAQQVFNSVPEAHYHLNYAKILENHRQALDSKSVPSEPLFRSDPPKLDLKVRILFEENLHTMVFPKVKELLFRVSRSSPVELAAKALARKNQHSVKWQDYSFTLIKAKEQTSETKVEDLSVTFDSLMATGQDKTSSLLIQDELVLFYRVKDLEPFDFKGAAAASQPQLETTQTEEESTTINEDGTSRGGQRQEMAATAAAQEEEAAQTQATEM